MPSKLGFGKHRNSSATKMKYGSAMYYKNPVKMLGDLDKDGKMSGYESSRQAAIEKNTKGSGATFKSDGQRKAAYASGYKGKGK